MSPHPAGGLAVALPLPESILSMADATQRQRATDVWRAASQLRGLMEQWKSWYYRLRTTGDADPGLAIRMREAVCACVRGLCALGVSMPTFRDVLPEDLFSRFPAYPDGLLDPPWQQNEFYLTQSYDRLRHPGWNRLLAELLGYLQILEVTPSVGLSTPPSPLPLGKTRPHADTGTGASKTPEDSEGDPQGTTHEALNDREKELLSAYFLLEATSPRRAKSLDDVAKKADPSSPSTSYKRANARLVRMRMLEKLPASKKQRMYLSTLGLAELERIKQARTG